MNLRTIIAEGEMDQEIKFWKTDGIDRLSALTQGVGFDGKTPYFGLVAYAPFDKVAHLDSLS